MGNGSLVVSNSQLPPTPGGGGRITAILGGLERRWWRLRRLWGARETARFQAARDQSNMSCGDDDVPRRETGGVSVRTGSPQPAS